MTEVMESTDPSINPMELIFGFFGLGSDVPKRGTQEYDFSFAFTKWLVQEMKNLKVECVLEGWSYYNQKKVFVGSLTFSFDLTESLRSMLKKKYRGSSLLGKIYSSPFWETFKGQMKGYCLFDAETYHSVKIELLGDSEGFGETVKAYVFTSTELN